MLGLGECENTLSVWSPQPQTTNQMKAEIETKEEREHYIRYEESNTNHPHSIKNMALVIVPYSNRV